MNADNATVTISFRDACIIYRLLNWRATTVEEHFAVAGFQLACERVTSSLEAESSKDGNEPS